MIIDYSVAIVSPFSRLETLMFASILVGTARCQSFRERPGRLKAAKNMILNGIDGNVSILLAFQNLQLHRVRPSDKDTQ